MSEVFILSGRRSAVMPKNGAFSALNLQELAAPVIEAALKNAGLEADEVDELILSNALGAGGNPARICALAGGLSDLVAGLSIDRQCAGGLDALLIGRALIASGEAQVVVAGGVESYSRRPLRARTFSDGRPPETYLRPAFTPWPDSDPDMNEAAEQVAQSLEISRTAQDLWAGQSHAKALARAKHGWPEIVPILGAITDGFSRNLTPDILARAPVLCGSITAANCAVEADGAGFVVLASKELAAKQARSGHCGPLGPMRIISGATLGGDPSAPALAPIEAMRRALARACLTIENIHQAEVMEAYAAQTIACTSAFELDPALVNCGGGGLARGHPIGASGAILAVRMFHDLVQGQGLASIAAAGGLASAVIFAR